MLQLHTVICVDFFIIIFSQSDQDSHLELKEALISHARIIGFTNKFVLCLLALKNQIQHGNTGSFDRVWWLCELQVFPSPTIL